MKTSIFSIILGLFLLGCASGKQQNNTSEQASFQVEGVCKMCKKRIENAALISGVKMAQWDLESGMLTVYYNSGKTSLMEIQKAVAQKGHDTEQVKASEEAYQKLPGCCAYRDGVEKH
jgi:hypothetical protein